jgi:hypothetical protein
MTDLFVIAAASLTFAAAYTFKTSPRPEHPSEQTREAIAHELGVTSEQLQHAIDLVPPPPRGAHLTDIEKSDTRFLLASTLNVPVEKLDAVMKRHRPSRQD